MKEALLPCPFCGGEAKFGSVEGDPELPQTGGNYIECSNPRCRATTCLVFPLKEDVTQELTERWNLRAPAPTHDEAFEALAREYKSDANAERHDRDSYAEERVAARDDFAERIFAILAQKVEAAQGEPGLREAAIEAAMDEAARQDEGQDDPYEFAAAVVDRILALTRPVPAHPPGEGRGQAMSAKDQREAFVEGWRACLDALEDDNDDHAPVPQRALRRYPDAPPPAPEERRWRCEDHGILTSVFTPSPGPFCPMCRQPVVEASEGGKGNE